MYIYIHCFVWPPCFLVLFPYSLYKPTYSGCIPMIILQPLPTCSVAAKMCGTPNLGMMGNSSMFNGIIIGKLFPVGLENWGYHEKLTDWESDWVWMKKWCGWKNNGDERKNHSWGYFHGYNKIGIAPPSIPNNMIHVMTTREPPIIPEIICNSPSGGL